MLFFIFFLLKKFKKKKNTTIFPCWLQVRPLLPSWLQNPPSTQNKNQSHTIVRMLLLKTVESNNIMRKVTTDKVSRCQWKVNGTSMRGVKKQQQTCKQKNPTDHKNNSNNFQQMFQKLYKTRWARHNIIIDPIIKHMCLNIQILQLLLIIYCIMCIVLYFKSDALLLFTVHKLFLKI